ncbi:MAG: ABC transporter substrate-binding protein [Betaproteobacteria bacterium]|nr:MAG: ABC transporter substrate-binding protein [Betaproteobacteria bacterium]
MNRRTFIGTLAGGLVAAPFAADAQPAAQVPRIGVLESNSSSKRLVSFKQGLKERGYVEGKSIVFEYRWANGKVAEFPRLAADLVRLKVDVIFAGTTPAALAARDATNAIPIVFATVADPIGVKLVSSLPRPGGNVTGLTTNNTEVAGKRLEIFKEMLGGKVSRLAMLFNPADASNVLALQTVEDSARKLNVTLRPFPAKGPEDFAGAFSAMASERIDAVLVAAGVLTLAHARDVAELATGARLPAMYGAREFVEAGGLVSYSASFADNYRRAATYVDKILKGAKPADLPVEQATKFELVIHLKTAKALGLTIPQSLLLRADEVIQ